MSKLRRGAAWFAAIIGLLFLVAGIAFILFTGPRNLDAYPDAATSPYLLPWKAGDTHFCVQSNRAVVSHRGWEEFAYDFVMPVGTNVYAARAGEVIKVVVNNDGHGHKWPNNKIVILHDDGTMAEYLHIKKDGNIVHEHDHVEQGQLLCASGHVGNSAMPHLHFHVTNADRSATLPVSFRDVDYQQGVPRMFHSYTSGNVGEAAK